jgi:hypothetical protein
MEELEPQPLQPDAGAATGADAGTKPKPRRRGWCACCLALVLLPLIPLVLLLVWASSGPAPAPLRCLPPDAPVRVNVRQPTDLVMRLLKSDTARSLAAGNSDGNRNLPDLQELEKLKFFMEQILGEEAAAAVTPDGKFTVASRPGLLARMAERLLREQLAKDANLAAARIGRTLILAPDRVRLDTILAESGRILAGQGIGDETPAPDCRAELFLNNLQPAAFGAGESPLRQAECLLDLPGLATISGRLGLDNRMGRVSGRLLLGAAASGGAPARFVAAEPASARLVSREALLYWAWNAPAGQGRWGSAGRFDALLAAFGQDFDSLFAPPFETPATLEASAALRGELRNLLKEEMTGERAAFIVSQQRAGGGPLLAAAGALFQVRDQARAWPRILRLLETFYLKAEDGKPPTMNGLPAEPFLQVRRESGCEFLELCYLTYPHGSGFRPAFGMAGDWFVACTSKEELKQVMNRSAGAGTPAISGAPELLLTGADASDASGLFLLRPAGHGAELADLLLAAQRDSASTSAPAAEETDDRRAREAETLGRLLDRLIGLHARWQPQADGRMQLLLEAELVR